MKSTIPVSILIALLCTVVCNTAVCGRQANGEENPNAVVQSDGIDPSVIQDIYSHEQWGYASRVGLVKFLERYRSAFALGQLDYIRAVCNDHMEMPEKQRLIDAYLSNLQKAFAEQESIDIRFDSISVKKLGRNGERYQMIIKQSYSSATGAEQGYLFLLLDMTDPEQPITRVCVYDKEMNRLMHYGEWNF